MKSTNLLKTKYTKFHIWTRDTSVTIVAKLLTGKPTNCGSVCGRNKWSLSTPKHRDNFAEHPVSYSLDIGGFSPWVYSGRNM